MLNPGEKGWLKEYLEFRKSILTKEVDGTKIEKPHHRHPDESLYSMLQPTGLMYGQPVPKYQLHNYDVKSWNGDGLLKVLLAEGLVNSALLYHEPKIGNVDDLSDIILKTFNDITDFYTNIYPELSTSSWTIFGKKKQPLEVTEKILEKRIGIKATSKDNFWMGFFHNCLLFLDIFFFGQWLHTKSELAVSEFFKAEKEDFRFLVVKVIVAAAYANNIIEAEERQLFKFFLESAKFPSNLEKEAMNYLDNGIDLDEIVIPEDSWILKKYFLELAILTVWADKRIEDSEVDFLEKFSKRLGLNEEDLENSMIAIEGFVLEHWDDLDQLQVKHDLQQVSEKYIERISKVLERNKNRINNKLRDSKEISALMIKARKGELTSAEEQILKDALVSILETIPTFVLISLPNTFLTLPILLKILPQTV